jgi:hypothetical protein
MPAPTTTTATPGTYAAMPPNLQGHVRVVPGVALSRAPETSGDAVIQHRTFQPAPPNWAHGGQRRFAAPPAGPSAATAVIPGPRPAPAFGMAPAGLRPYPGPPVPEVRIRPRLLWVGLSWLLFGVLVLAGVVTFVAGSGTEAGPDRFFGGGEVATIELDPAADPLIYAALAGGGYVTCEPVGPAADAVLLAPTSTDWSVTVGGREWHAAFHLVPAVSGTYQIRCEGAGASFGVGDRSDTAATGGRWALALVVLPLVGLATGVTTTVVVLTRRRAAQDRLFGPWTGGATGRPAQPW